jgi:hypothetical protein
LDVFAHKTKGKNVKKGDVNSASCHTHVKKRYTTSVLTSFSAVAFATVS